MGSSTCFISRLYLLSRFWCPLYCFIVSVTWHDVTVLNVCRQAYCVFMFLAAVSLFATLISQLNEILESSGTFTRQLHRNFEAYLELRPRNFLLLVCANTHFGAKCIRFYCLSN